MSNPQTTKRRERLKKINKAMVLVDCALLELRQQEKTGLVKFVPSLNSAFDSLYYLERLARKAP
jgi:hypothetical protein